MIAMPSASLAGGVEDGRGTPVDPLLTVVYATATSAGVVTQNISGPFDLGRPHGCPKSALGGKTRIPAGGVEIGGSTTTTAKQKANAKRKSAATKKLTARRAVRR